MNKKIKFFGLLLAILLLAGGQAFALQCQAGRDIEGTSDNCWVSGIIASNETTLVSNGTVLVFDVTNAQNDADNTAFQFRVSDASADGVVVAGVAQKSWTSGSNALILARGKGDLAVNATDAITSGNALFVGVSGNATITTSNTQNQLGFALENQTSSGTPARNTRKAYITIV